MPSTSNAVSGHSPGHTPPPDAATRRRLFRAIPASDARELEATLQRIFGISNLRPGQREVIESVLQGHDTLAIMPTGAGKSLCYQLPALKMPGTTVVVSPLISLMKDQAEKLNDAGVAAEEVNSTLSKRQEQEAIANIEQENSEFVFTTPERLGDPEFLETIRHNKIDLVVIDEAHCISQWGHDFRPAYLQIGTAISVLGDPPVLALTATATDAVIADIRKQLNRPQMRVFNTGIYRPNLRYRVIAATEESEKLGEIIRLLQETNGPGIIYAATVKHVEELHQALRDAGESVARYHGQLPAKERMRNQELFMAGSRRVMVATNAFGMGIDKPDVRFVIHHQIPANLEAYYQESGRAGRDGNDAECVLLYDLKDKRVQQFFLARRYPSARDVGAIYKALRSIAAGEPRISLARLQEELGQVSHTKLQVALKLLKDGGLVMQDNNLDYRLTRKHANASELALLVETYEHKSERDHEALERMVFYAQTGFCRWKVLLEYFGAQTDFERCCTCDNCVRPPEQILSPVPVRQHAPVTAKPASAPALAAGAAVKVAKFGQGQVVSVVADKVTIVFPNSVRKTFLREYVEPA